MSQLLIFDKSLNLKKSYLLILFVLTSLFGFSQGNEFASSDSSGKNWGFIITPYALLASQSTDVGGEKLRQSFNDLSSITNTGFQLYTGVRYKRFIASFDGTYALLQSNQKVGPADVNLSINQYILDSKIGYVIHQEVDYNKIDEAIRGWSIEANVGVKYWKNDVDVAYQIGLGSLPPIEDEFRELQEWSDLMIGVKSRIILNKRVLLGISGDIGGFGIGNSSDLSWDFTFANTFKVHDLIYITAGYRSFNYSRTDASVDTKVSVQGPILGVSLVF